MFKALTNKNYVLDPRTFMLLLIIVNIVTFIQRSVYVEAILVGSIALLQVMCNCKSLALKWLTAYITLLCVQYYVLPVSPTFIKATFSVLSLYSRKFFPCFMLGTIIVRTTPVRHLIIALQKWKFPQQIIIPLSITMRYFPAIKEEMSYIRDALKLRDIRGVSKLEYCLVPLMISATNTAEELGAAAVTRGIENPVKKTSIVEMNFRASDYLCLVIGLGFIAMALVMR
ncbi:energy-coupling factor transporter transmembrane protein EcfT [Clostridium sp. 'deep sea']|uniref:energy-coupling factor transporter transmembrane component T n=1 Tax=Clostridium sp. 'deep sea' TaxID=2779445 RepID=UPI0018964BAD|nr:energy-coupling factor transporter transmembrane component T [Clostridium sp. 'deep sea']QOR35075.1 energy-coupling factor transporter transmembrane protein EcfT [Clostridium sp. 'deep sea']